MRHWAKVSTVLLSKVSINVPSRRSPSRSSKRRILASRILSCLSARSRYSKFASTLASFVSLMFLKVRTTSRLWWSSSAVATYLIIYSKGSLLSQKQERAHWSIKSQPPSTSCTRSVSPTETSSPRTFWWLIRARTLKSSLLISGLPRLLDQAKHVWNLTARYATSPLKSWNRNRMTSRSIVGH